MTIKVLFIIIPVIIGISVELFSISNQISTTETTL